jgi:hypothetical protein
MKINIKRFCCCMKININIKIIKFISNLVLIQFKFDFARFICNLRVEMTRQVLNTKVLETTVALHAFPPMASTWPSLRKLSVLNWGWYQSSTRNICMVWKMVRYTTSNLILSSTMDRYNDRERSCLNN